MKAKEFIFENIKSLIFERVFKELEYKGYTIRVVDQQPKIKGFKGIAFREYRGKTDSYTIQEPKSTSQEVEKELMDYVDSKRKLSDNSLEQFKGKGITLFLNTPFSRQVFGPDAILYADIEKVNGKPVLIISDEDQGGMRKVSDRSAGRRGGIGAVAFPRQKAIESGLTLSRYDLGKEIEYEIDNVKAYELEWNSDVLPDEPIRLAGPGVTVSPPKKGTDMIESLILSEVDEILKEAKKIKPSMPKQRDPNWRTMQSIRQSGAAGSQGNKKRDQALGKEKYKTDLKALTDDQSLSELKKPGGTAFLKFSIKNSKLYAFIGLGNDYKEVRAVNATIPDTMISSEQDLMRLIQTALLDSMYAFEKIRIVLPKAVKKNYEFIEKAIEQITRRFEKRIDVIEPDPLPGERSTGSGIKKKKVLIKPQADRPMPVKEPINPNNMRVSFITTNADFDRLLRSAGFNFQDGKFLISYPKYKELKDLLKNPKVINRFGNRDLIIDKKFIESTAADNETI